MYPAEHYVTALSQMEMFGKTAKFINHANLVPNLYKDLDYDRHTAVDKQMVLTESTRHVAMSYPHLTPHGYNLHHHDRNVVCVTWSKTKQD